MMDDPLAGLDLPPEGGGGAFRALTPEVDARAAESIVEGPDGGLCFECAHFVPPNGCTGYQDDPMGEPQLEVIPERIQDSAAFRPSLTGGGPEGPGGPPPMGPDPMGGPPLPPPPGGMDEGLL